MPGSATLDSASPTVRRAELRRLLRQATGTFPPRTTVPTVRNVSRCAYGAA